MKNLTSRVGDLQEALRIEWSQKQREDIISDYERALKDSPEYQEADFHSQIAAETSLRSYALGIGAY